MRKALLVVGMAAFGLVSGLAATAPVAAEGWQPFTAEPAGAKNWRPARMSLGLRADRWSGEDSDAKPVKPHQQCRRWRAMATKLGETFAGHTVRQSVLKRVCGLIDSDRVEEGWDWPWGGLDKGQLLPPRTHRVSGAWEIRCGADTGRRRCALLHAAPLPPDDRLEPGDPIVVTHFVIDMVAGRESLLWRMFVPTDPAATDLSAAAGEIAAQVAGVAPLRTSTREVRYSLGRGEQVERFAACVKSGCIMEANLARGSAVANRLWEGAPVEVAVTLSSGRIVPLALPPRGFRAGLAELMRLRREETRPPARRP